MATRPGADADYDFLYALHKHALGPYVELTWGWEEEVQAQWFRERFDPGANEVILRQGDPIGCLRVKLLPDCVFVDYIALLPEHQGQGIGTSFLSRVQKDAASQGLPVRLNVLKVNPAKALYERLGYRVIDEDEVRWFMESDLAQTG